MSKTFIVVVGDGGKEFTLHTDVAVRSSKFFHAAMSNDWNESRQNRVTLKEPRTVNFEFYLQWLSTNEHSFLGDLALYQLAELYILGDFLDDLAFRVTMINHFVKRAVDNDVHPGSSIVTPTWERTPEGSPLRKIIVEIWIACPIKNLAARFTKPGRDFPKAFIIDCLQRIGDTQARAKVEITGDERRRMIESRRDELLKELVA